MSSEVQGTPGTSAPPSFGALPLLSEEETWLAAATTAQVPGAGGADGSRVAAAVWFNTPADEASFQLTDQGLAGAVRISIRCGLAGVAGPVVWTSSDIGRWVGTTSELLGRDLLSTAASAACPVAIRNVVSLKAAAQARLLYFEVERAGSTLRGQFWPNSTASASAAQGLCRTPEHPTSKSSGACASRALAARADRCVVLGEPRRSSGVMRYEVPRRDRFRAVTIHCAPAGVDGPAVATLPIEHGALSNSDLLPLPAGTACGMPITTTASLLEALLRGHLYAVVEPIEPAGLTLRGQFRAP